MRRNLKDTFDFHVSTTFVPCKCCGKHKYHNRFRGLLIINFVNENNDSVLQLVTKYNDKRHVNDHPIATFSKLEIIIMNQILSLVTKISSKEA